MCKKNANKIVSIALLSLGAGILLSFFLPEKVLVVMESVLIVAIGVLSLLRK